MRTSFASITPRAYEVLYCFEINQDQAKCQRKRKRASVESICLQISSMFANVDDEFTAFQEKSTFSKVFTSGSAKYLTCCCFFGLVDYRADFRNRPSNGPVVSPPPRRSGSNRGCQHKPRSVPRSSGSGRTEQSPQLVNKRITNCQLLHFSRHPYAIGPQSQHVLKMYNVCLLCFKRKRI